MRISFSIGHGQESAVGVPGLGGAVVEAVDGFNKPTKRVVGVKRGVASGVSGTDALIHCVVRKMPCARYQVGRRGAGGFPE